MGHLTVSKDGKVGCGGCFTSCRGNCVPGTINLLKGIGENDVVHPDHVAFSSFGVARSSRLGANAVYNPGDHVAIVYNDANIFFSAVIVRCDTWAVQWGVERSACLADAQVTHLANLCANTVCGVATSQNTTTQPGKQRVFIATRFDTLTTSQKANKEWRSFLASPRAIETGFEDETIVCITAYDGKSFLLLTLKGSLVLVRLNVDVLRSRQQTDISLFEVRLVGSKLRGVSKKSRLVVYEDEDAKCVYTAIYSQGGNDVQLLQLSGSTSEPADASELAVVTEISTSVPVDALAFAGPFHLCFCSHRAETNVQFCGLVPGAAALETMPFDPLSAPYAPLGVFYNDTNERVVFLSSSLGSTKFAAATDAQKVSSIIEASLDFSAGPFGQDSLATASWASVANPYRHHGLRTNRLADNDSDEEGGDVQVLKEATAHNAGRWMPLTLCYALCTTTAPRGTDVAVFSVTTAPFLHTRLVKQWHNATAGLKKVVSTVSPRSYNAVAFPWNPRHIRRTLRLLSQQELSALLHCLAVAISASERLSSPVRYADATTAAVEMALHVITLARQMGAVLNPDDVKTVAVMLRACRECGHELLRYASRMELLMESCLQQKAMSRVLRRRTTSTQGVDNTTAQELERNFYGISPELQTERMLHTRYTSNTWAQHLATHESSYRSAGAGALRFLLLVKHGKDSTGERALSDWRRLGMAPHQDPILDEFEKTLL